MSDRKSVHRSSQCHQLSSRTKASRPGLTDQAAVLLTERSIRRNAGLSSIACPFLFNEPSLLDGKLQFTRDEALKIVRKRQFHCDSICSMSVTAIVISLHE